MSEEGLITMPMVNKATYLLHKLATRRGAEFKDIQKKCKERLGYTNLAKVPLAKGHAIISKLIEWTGGEEEEPPTPDSTVKDNLTLERTVQEAEATDDLSKHETDVRELKDEPTKEKTEEDLVTATMRESIKAAVDITLTEVMAREIPVMGLGGFVLEVGKVLFEAKMLEIGNPKTPKRKDER